MNVLLVEDDRKIAAVVSQALCEEGHNVDTLTTGLHAEEHILTMPYHVAVLDLMLPERDGFQILRKARAARSTLPIVVLSARDGVMDIVRALDLGADDYVTKPFHLDVLLARVRSVSRRGSVAEPATLSAAGIVLDPARREISRREVSIGLTRREFALLELLMRRTNTVVTRRQLIEAAWGLDAETTQNSLEFHIHSLRSKIDVHGQPSLIRTVRGMGYRFGS